MDINDSTLIKGAVQSAAEQAREKFNLVNGGDIVAKNEQLRASLTDFMDRIASAQRENGALAFEFSAPEFALGHAFILSVKDNDQLSIELNVSDTSTEFSIQVNEHMKKDNEYSYRTTEMEAFQAIAAWAGRKAPDAEKDLYGIIETFFVDRNKAQSQAEQNTIGTPN